MHNNNTYQIRNTSHIQLHQMIIYEMIGDNVCICVRLTEQIMSGSLAIIVKTKDICVNFNDDVQAIDLNVT